MNTNLNEIDDLLFQASRKLFQLANKSYGEYRPADEIIYLQLRDEVESVRISISKLIRDNA